MRFDLTLRCASSDHDVAVLTRAPVALSALRAQLARITGVAADAAWSGADGLIDADTRLGSAWLRTGSVISVGAAARAEGSVEQGGYAVRVVGGPSAGRCVPLGRRELTIGRGPCNDVVLDDDRVSRRHATINMSGSTVRIRDHRSTNGTSVDGRPVDDAGRDIRPDDVIRVGDSLLTVSTPDITPLLLGEGSDTAAVNRTPRRAPTVDAPEIVLPDPPDNHRPRPVQWFAVLLPAAAAGAISWFTHSPIFLLVAALTPLMMLSGAVGDRVHWRRSRRRATFHYRQRRTDADRRVLAAVHAETLARRAECPDPVTLALLATTPAAGLWAGDRGAALRVRIGTADQPASVRTRSTGGTGPAGTVRDVPLALDLRAGPVGLAGPAEVVAGLARWLVAQLAVVHSPIDVTIAMLLAPDTAPRWQWARWLPHLGVQVAARVMDWPELVSDLARQVSTVGSVGSAPVGSGSRLSPRFEARPLHWTVLVVDAAGQLADIPGLNSLLTTGPAAGLTAVCVDTDVHALPASCSTVIEVDGPSGTRVVMQPGGSRALIDCVDGAWADRVARSLAPLVDAAGTDAGAVPAACRLLDLLDADDLDVDRMRTRWAVSDGRPHTVLGMSADGPIPLDLAADGPHLLVAGTTGAGKSELLQSLVTGLALLHPPDELSFLLVDYKGGAAFAGCSRLPHATGLVTDLDPQLTRRALQSLDAELRRREQLFAAARAVDLDAYRIASPTEEIARLVIVVDEFATLADELPDFVRGLVSVAQRGRSLGIHLVLATQRPGSAVSPEIRANTSARIALRVTDPIESSDVLDVPDAAVIDRRTPGRGYLRTGTKLVLFQTARVSAARAPQQSGAVVEPLGPWRRRLVEQRTDADADELARIVSAVTAAAAAAGSRPPRRPWLPPLPSTLETRDLPRGGTSDTYDVPIGLVDLPAEQAQLPMLVDLGQAVSTLVIGGPGSGRSTALAALALTAARTVVPGELEVYVIDSGAVLTRQLRGLPHVVTCLEPNAGDLVGTLLQRLQIMLARRESAARPDMPTTLLLVDGWDRVLAGHDDAGVLRYADLLTALLRTGPAARLTTVVTGDRTLLSPRVAGHFGERLLLRLADPQDYLLAGIPVGSVPRHMPAGRGLRASDGAQFQLARPGTSDSVRELAARWSGARHNPDAVSLRPLPVRVALHELPGGERLRLGLAGDDARPLALDPFTGSGRWLVAGPPRSGRSTALATLLVEARRLSLAVLVAAPRRSPLDALARDAGIRVIGPADDTVGEPPNGRALLLVDDSDAYTDTAAGDALTAWTKQSGELAVVLSGRCDDLATTFRGLAAEVRRSRCGLLLRPGPVDGELFGLRLGRHRGDEPPGRGLLIGEPAWGPLFRAGDPVSVQVATTELDP